MSCDCKLLLGNATVISNGKIHWTVSHNILCFCIVHCSLDELLDGGLYTGELAEIVGPAGVGKSQVKYIKESWESWQIITLILWKGAYLHVNGRLFSIFIILWIAVFEIILFQLDLNSPCTSKWYWYYSTLVLIIPKKIKTCFNICTTFFIRSAWVLPCSLLWRQRRIFCTLTLEGH